ncbi:MAG TPA: hypothetical protein ENG00_01560 [Candidatus Aenigmarchaeota archaeon]|nr:hypothetical protein [Candidatus Aenigmarchaeota archaeon]
MRFKKYSLSILVIGLLLISANVTAQGSLTCSAKKSCSANEIDVFHMYQLNDSHAELSNQSNYQWRICCSGVQGLNNISQGVRFKDYDIVLRLFNQTNSHVQENTESGYPYEVYISVDSGGVEVKCNYTSTDSCSIFGPEYTCLATIYDKNNSHVADCDGVDDFPIKVCCKVEADVTPPDFNITEPSREWTNTKIFYVNWTVSDNYGITCSNVLWSDDSTVPWKNKDWKFITRGSLSTECTSLDSILFGPDEPIEVKDGVTYYFTGNATDWTGNTGEWIEPVNTTIDTVFPEVYVNTTDQFGREIIGGWVKADVTLVNITTMATDNISGVEKNILHWWLTQNNQYTYGSEDCGSAPSWGGWSNCSKEFSYDEDTVIKYQIETIDRAGNVNKTRFMFTTTHPLANFVIHDLAMQLGSSVLLKVQVRNIQTVPDNITISLDSTFVPAKPTFEDVGTGDYEIQADGSVLQVRNINPMEERDFFVRVYTSEIGEYTINITASSNAAAPYLTDTDSLKVIVGYPPSFPGLSEWAVSLIIILSCIIYFQVNRLGTGDT